MIHYSLKCADGHKFDSWFQSGAAFDKLLAAGMVSCAHCGSIKVQKLLMAPSVRPARSAAERTDPAVPSAMGQDTASAAVGAPAGAHAAPVQAQGPQARGALSAPATEQEKAIQELKKHVEANAQYVGGDFVKRAREIHGGTAPEASIYGEARPDEARALLDEGIPVLPLPFRPNTRNN